MVLTRQWRPWGSLVLGVGFQEPQQLLQEQEKQPAGSRSSGPYMQGVCFQEHSSVVLIQGHRFPWHFRVCSSGLGSRGDHGVQCSYVC
jgi:hypothetical protein